MWYRYFAYVIILPVSFSFGKTAVPVFLLCGQSNMVSMASVNDLDSDEKQTINNVMINASGDCDASKKGNWLPLGPGFGSQAANFGLELTFGKTLADSIGKTLADSMPGQKIAIIKNAINGSPLGQLSGWLPPSSNNGKSGSLYTNMLAHVAEALASFDNAFDTAEYMPRWAGFVWLQGESDAMNPELAQKYEANLDNLINDLRDTLGVPDLPVIIPLISASHWWADSVKIWNADIAVREKYENIDTLQTKLYEQPDDMHYNAVGQLAIGRVAAQRWLAMTYVYEGTTIVQHPGRSFLPQRQKNNTSLPTMVVAFDLLGRKHFPAGVASFRRRTPVPMLFIKRGEGNRAVSGTGEAFKGR